MQQLVLLALLQIEIAEQLTAMEYRLRKAGGGRVDDRLGSQQQFKNRAFIAAFTGERDARQELRARVDDIGVGGGEIGFGFANIGSLREQFRWQPRGDTRISNAAQASAADLDALGRPPHQNCKGHAIEAQRLLKRRNGRASGY